MYHGMEYAFSRMINTIRIARKAPKNGVISPELYFVQGNALTNKMPMANIELGDLLNILNKKWGITEDILNLSKQRN